MRRSSRCFLFALLLYLAFGIAYQIWTCATWSSNLGQDGSPPDIPCAGIPWTIITVVFWPVYSSLDLRNGHPLAGASFFGAFVIVVVFLAVGIRRDRQK